MPPYVVKRSVDDPAIRKQVLDGFKTGVTRYALDWPQDCARQRFWSKVTYYHQIDKFRKVLLGRRRLRARVEPRRLAVLHGGQSV